MSDFDTLDDSTVDDEVEAFLAQVHEAIQTNRTADEPDRAPDDEAETEGAPSSATGDASDSDDREDDFWDEEVEIDQPEAAATQPETIDQTMVAPIDQDGATLLQEPVTMVGDSPIGQPAGFESFDVEPAEPKKRRRRWPTVVLALLVLAGGAYLAGAFYFMNTFLPNTTLNGEDISLKRTEEVAAANNALAEDFTFAVTGDGIDLDITPESIKVTYDGESYARAAIAQQHPFEWPLELLQGSHELTAKSVLTYDAARLSDVVGSAIDAANKDAVKSKDASIKFDAEKKRYEIVPEVLGTEVDKTGAIKQVRSALDAGEQQAELGEDLLLLPEVRSDDPKLTSVVDEGNSYMQATQELVTHDKTVATIGEDQLVKWVSMNDDMEFTFDEEACATWAKGDLSRELDSYGSTRTYTRPDGASITVSGGTYGWIIDGADIASNIAKNVMSGKAGTVDVSFKQTAESWNPGGQDWGSRYIDVDLTAQYVRFYDGDTVIWETECVTGGLDSKGEMHNTPTGVYAINDNKRSGNVKLTGKTDPKTLEPEYISYVDYWMPFIDDSVALHDADWRSSFGGSIYLSNGSHGCVNLPVAKAKELYDMAAVGTVVVVHD